MSGALEESGLGCFFSTDPEGAPINMTVAGMVEPYVAGSGYVVRDRDGSTIKDGVDWLGHPRLKVFGDVWDAYEVARELSRGNHNE